MVLESVARNIDRVPLLDLFILNIAMASFNGFLAAVAFCQVFFSCLLTPFLCNLWIF